MGESVTFRPALVRAWAAAARASGDDVRGTRGKVNAADDDASYARIRGLTSQDALTHYTDVMAKGLTNVAGDVEATGSKLANTVSVVAGTDDETANLFRRWGGPCR